jgi:DNA repair exonuclease SbcCD ATPase subunit
MTSPLDDNILDRLARTIDSWTGEVSGAHATLTHEIEETRKQLGHLIGLIQAHSGGEVVTPADRDAEESAFQEQLVALEREIEELKALKKQEHRTTQQMRLDYAVIQNKLQLATAALESVLSENTTLKESRDKQGEGIAPELSELMSTIERVTQVHEQTQDQHLELHHQHRHSLSELQLRQQELADLHTEHDQLSLRYMSLAAEHQETQSTLATTQADKNVAERRSHQLAEDQEALKEQVQRLHNHIADKEREIAALQEAVANPLSSEEQSALVAENSTLKDELGLLRIEFQKQAETLEQHIQSIQEFQEREAAFAEREDELRIEIAALKEKLDALSHEGLDSYADELEAKEARLSEASSWLEDVQDAASAVKTNLDALRDSVAHRTEDAHAASDLEGLLEAQRALNAEQQTQLEKLQGRIDVANKHTDEAVAKEIVALAAGAERAKELGAAHTHIAELQRALAEQKAEIESLRGSVESMVAGDAGDETKKAKSPFDAFDDSGQQRAIGEILLKAGIISETELFNVLVEQNRNPERRLGSILIEQGLVQEDTVAKVLASQLRLEYVDLNRVEIEPDVLSLLTGRFATHHMCIPIRRTSEGVELAMANPMDLIAIEELERTIGLSILPVVAPLSDITSAIVQYYGANFESVIDS